MPEKKPPRMRAACGQCHSAKVKCSGERNGCTRCAKLGLVCEYGVSMVGRASKRKNNDPEEASTDDVTMLDAAPNDTQQWARTNGLVPRDSLMFSTGTDPNLQLLPQDLLSITGLDDLSFHAFPDYLPGDENMFATESSFPAIDGNIHSTPSNTDSSTANGTSPATNVSSDSRSGNGVSNPSTGQRTTPPDFPQQPLSMSAEFERYDATTSVEPIFVLARITMYLENQLKDESLPLDRTLAIVKASLKELMDQVGTGRTLISIGCRALIFASVQNIVRLYSRSLRQHREGSRGQPQATFKLGSFEIDPEDQLKLQNQAIAAELGRCIRQIKKLTKDWSHACEHGENCRGVMHYKEIEKQMQDMREDLETAQMQMIRQEFEKTSVHDKRLMHPLI